MHKFRELSFYILIGGIATLIDWGIFDLTFNYFYLNYLYSLALSMIFAGSFHFTANKIFTFQCESKKLGSQLSLFVVASIISVVLTVLILSVLIKLFNVNALYLRMVTTAIMLIPNYLLHKFITFNKRIFATDSTLQV